MIENPEQLGARIKELMGIRGMNATELGESVGKTRATAYNWFAGKIPLGELWIVAKALNMSVADLFDGEGGLKEELKQKDEYIHDLKMQLQGMERALQALGVQRGQAARSNAGTVSQIEPGKTATRSRRVVHKK